MHPNDAFNLHLIILARMRAAFQESLDTPSLSSDARERLIGGIAVLDLLLDLAKGNLYTSGD